MASDVCKSVGDGFVSAILSHMSRLFCIAGNWKYCRLLHSYMFLPLVHSSASYFRDIGSLLWKTVWWPCVHPMKIQLIASWWYFKAHSVNLTYGGEL